MTNFLTTLLRALIIIFNCVLKRY